MKAIYGSVALQRERCPECQDVAFVIDGEMACCGAQLEKKVSKLRRMSVATGIRQRPGVDEQRAILSRQRGRCFYCGSVFGDFAVSDGGKRRRLAPNWDHVEPFCWQSNNQPWNFVAACSICNGIKGSKMFATPEDAVAYVWHRRLKKGWRSATECGPEHESRLLWRPVQ